MGHIFHITEKAAWEAAVTCGTYTAESLSNEGFIHCSTKAQVLGTADLLFRGRAGLCLLCINEDKVPARIAYEDCYETGQQFPHIYGALPTTAVSHVIAFPPRADGTFAFPPDFPL